MNCQAEFHPCTGARPGAARHLVLLPGWGMHGGVFVDLLPALCERFHVSVIDLPGFGDNAGVDGGGSLESLAAAVADAAPLQASWLGWSLGGMVAACVAANEPQRVQALVAVASNLSFVQRPGWQHAMPAETFAAFERDVAGDAAGALGRFLALQCQGAAGGRDDLRRLRDVAGARPVPARAALLDGLAVLRDADLRRAGGELACPSLWLYGEHDALVPAGVADSVSRRVARSRVAVLPGASHLPFFSAGASLRAQLDGFPEFFS